MSLPQSSYSTLFEESSDPLIVIDSETGVVRECNGRCREVCGFERETMTGRKFVGLVAAADSDDVVASLRRGNDPVRCRLAPAGGSSVPVELHPTSVTADGDDLLLVRIDERTDSEVDAAVKARAMDEAPIGITMSDPHQEENPLIYVNERFQELTGYSAADAVGRNCRFLQGEGTDEEASAEMGRAIDAEEPATVELRNYRADGSSFWNRVTVAPVYEDGDLRNFVGFQEDVTERVQLRRETELARDLLATIPSGVFRTTPEPDGTFEYANSALVSMLGADSFEQLRDHRVEEFYEYPSVRTELLDALEDVDDGYVQREVQLRTLDGERRDVLVTASMTTDDTGERHVHKVVQDVTDRNARERALERYERLVEDLPIGVYQNTPGPDGTFRLLNDAMVEMFDADSKAHLRNCAVRDLYADPDERAAFSEALREAGVVREWELRLETLTGDSFWGEVTAITREVDGQTVFDGLIQDVTERKRYKEQLEEQRDNLDILNQMLRHDIRNDLQVIIAYVDVLESHVDEEGSDHLGTIAESVDHAIGLTETARDMADVMLSTGSDRQPVNLRHVLEHELDDVRSGYSDAIFTVDGTIPATYVKANDMLDSVFRNLLTNAVQHNDEEIPEVTVSVDERDEEIAVSVADNGPGVPDAQKDEIFGRGEKGLESAGTGIGLYLVKTLVETYGGDVRVADNDPEGAVFTVELPVADRGT